MPMTSSRESMVKVGHTLNVLLMLLLLAPERQAQCVDPHRNDGVFENERETFDGSHIVHANAENDKYLFKGILANFTFTIPKNCTLTVTVTPCASEILWSLYMLNQPRSDLSWIGDQHHSLSKYKKLAQFSSEKRDTVRVNAKKGSYIISATSLHTDSYVKILYTTNPVISECIYPVVPANNHVNVLTNNKTLVLDWPAAAAVNKYRKSIEYCVTISRIKNFQSHCAALAHFHGDKKPRFALWDRSNEAEMIQDLLQRAEPIRRSPRSKIFHQCVGDKTSFTFTKAKRGKTYFVDVFLVDKEEKTSSAYVGTSITTKYRKRSTKTKMKVGETRTFNLKRKMAVEVKINSTLSRLAFEVVPCEGKIPFEIFYNGKKNQIKTLARRWKRHLIRNAKPGSYLLTFPGVKVNKTFVTVFVTSGPSRSQILVPKKRKIRVFGKLTTCSNITLAWMGSSVEQSYCLFKKKLKENRHESKRRQCLSPSERPKAEKEVCLRNSGKENLRQVMSYNVTGLQPNTLYRFDVYVKRGRSAHVPYKSVKVRTLAKCMS